LLDFNDPRRRHGRVTVHVPKSSWNPEPNPLHRNFRSRCQLKLRVKD
jgi:hypothetical protein